MKLHSQPKITTTKIKRKGQGYGSGKGGHTASRGQKGQKSRGSIRLSFTGSSWVWFKRLPFMRGKSRFGAITDTYTVSLADLNNLADGSIVDFAALRAAGLIKKSAGNRVVARIVANGKLTKKLTVQVPASAKAAEAITKAGGVYSVKAE